MVFSLLSSCTNSQVTEEIKKEVITERTAYDVTITGDNISERIAVDSSDMFSNMPDNDFESLAVKIFDKVKSNEIPAYFYNYEDKFGSFELIPKDQLNSLFDTEWSVYTVVYDTIDGAPVSITFTQPISAERITQLRFLEEWYFEGNEFCKRVIAVAPIFYSEHDNNQRSKFIPYWVFLKDIKE
jgi:hypothetical protein